MSDQIETGETTKKAKAAKAATDTEKLLAETRRWAVAAIVGPRVVQLRPAQLKQLVEKSLEAADIVLAAMEE